MSKESKDTKSAYNTGYYIGEVQAMYKVAQAMKIIMDDPELLKSFVVIMLKEVEKEYEKVQAIINPHQHCTSAQCLHNVDPKDRN